MPNIELEIRGECTDEFESLKKKLDELGEGRYETRTMAMFFGEVDGKGVDVRCRVTNSDAGVGAGGKAEVVTKVGDYHAHDRKEIGIEVSVEQVVEFARMFALMGFVSKGGSCTNKKSSKVGSRESWEYNIDGIDVSLVRGKSGLAYIEFEKIVSEGEVDEERGKLETLAEKLGVRLWTTGEQFYAFCNQFTTGEDWEFTGSDEDVERLKKEINS